MTPPTSTLGQPRQATTARKLPRHERQLGWMLAADIALMMIIVVVTAGMLF